ncbi:hypothetical protein AKG16_18580 [Morganella morganii]|nr:hypothetical protein AKG16_18580 [Morganella morganii]
MGSIKKERGRIKKARGDQLLDEQRQKAFIRDKGTNMISLAESRISLVHTLVRIMYIMLNDIGL